MPTKFWEPDLIYSEFIRKICGRIASAPINDLRALRGWISEAKARMLAGVQMEEGGSQELREEGI